MAIMLSKLMTLESHSVNYHITFNDWVRIKHLAIEGKEPWCKTHMFL